MTHPCPRCGEPLSDYRESELVTRWDCPNECNQPPGVWMALKTFLTRGEPGNGAA